jgi:hypothetical protein
MKLDHTLTKGWSDEERVQSVGYCSEGSMYPFKKYIKG